MFSGVRFKPGQQIAIQSCGEKKIANNLIRSGNNRHSATQQGLGFYGSYLCPIFRNTKLIQIINRDQKEVQNPEINIRLWNSHIQTSGTLEIRRWKYKYIYKINNLWICVMFLQQFRGKWSNLPKWGWDICECHFGWRSRAESFYRFKLGSICPIWELFIRS